METVWWNYPPPEGSSDRSWWSSGDGVDADTGVVPSYQQSILPTSFACCGSTLATGRGTPDVAAMAQGNGGWVGTSACSPFWVSLIAVINFQLGRNVGFINDMLYSLSPDAGAFRKIGTGNNIPPGSDCTPPSGSGRFPPCGYTATASQWDACTGLGVPDGSKLLAARRTPRNTPA